ncbi:tubulin epsilon chain-like isoform X2 [Rhopilema esculentum]
MEDSVVNEILQGSLRDVFDNRQFITDVYGSGNNWAVGHFEYGHRYRDEIANLIRRAAETCDCLQCFFCIHSMGGGTGSGLGTYVLRLLEDEFPDVYRFSTVVYPSEDDDVITSPYNSVLAMRQLTDGADCVIPIENQALTDIVKKIESSLPPQRSGKRVNIATTRTTGSGVKPLSAVTSSEGSAGRSSEKPFDGLNNIVANLILNITSSSRFEGSLNVDLNEITMNLVPFPKLHYLVSSMTPLYALADVNIPARRLDQMFTDAFSKDNQLLRVNPRKELYLACGMIVRGKVEISDLRRNIDRLRSSLNFVHWNQEGWKTGLCSVPPVGHQYSMLTLANNTCVREPFMDMKSRFLKLYKRKAHVHHYRNINGFEDNVFEESLESLNWLISEYERFSGTKDSQVLPAQRLKVAR